jgi:hypothetical protein
MCNDDDDDDDGDDSSMHSGSKMKYNGQFA